MIDYRPAAAEDRKAIAALLDAERLPSSDLAASRVVLITAGAGNRLVGCALVPRNSLDVDQGSSGTGA